MTGAEDPELEAPGSALDAALATAYVRTQGTPAEVARLRFIVSGTPPDAEAVGAALAGQREDGGWSAPWSGAQSALDATCYRLAIAEQLGVTASRTSAAAQHVAAALDFLAARQQPDGSWQEVPPAEGAAAMPRWLRPDEPESRLYLTASCGYWLAVLGGASHEAGAMAAADALEQELAEDGRLPSFAHTHWLAAGLLHRLDRSIAVTRLLDRVRISLLPHLTPADLAWLVTSLAAAGLPAHHPTVRAAVLRLGRAQGPDGRWPSDDAPDRHVHTTLEALRALRWFARSHLPSEQSLAPRRR